MMDEYQFVKSQMGKDKLLFRGHIYRHQRSRKNNHYFLCEDKSCNGSVTLRGVIIFNALGGSVSEGKAHNHVPVTRRVKIMQALDEIKFRAKTSTLAPATIVQEVRQELGINNEVEMPSISAMRQVIHRIRKKGLPVEPQIVTDLNVPNNLSGTESEEKNFLLFDTRTDDDQVEDNEERIIAFCTEENLRKLQDSDIWFLDGTFKTFPQLFHHLYTIHYMFYGECFPAVYVLMTGKTQEMYTSMLERLFSAAETKGVKLNPAFIIVDFELGSINALRQIFPEAKLSGCFFHLGQSIYRNIQKNGLVDSYKSNDNVALSLRKLCALAFLPPEEIYDAFIALSNSIPNEVEPVYKYFGETYVLGRPILALGKEKPRRNQRRHSPRYPPTMWSIHHLQTYNLPKINNNLEAWHRRFETVVESYHLGDYSMIKEFIKENNHTDQEMKRLIAVNCSSTNKNKEQIQKEERLEAIIRRYGTVPQDEYLREIAHNLHLNARNVEGCEEINNYSIKEEF